MGEGGRDAADYGFRFRAGGEKKKYEKHFEKIVMSQGQWYDVQVSLRDNERGLAYFGHDWESRVIERFVR